jgi:CheY-like chemotaxis protein
MQHKVLVVDDNPRLLGDLVWVLEEEGYIAYSATNGVTALEQIQFEKPHLVVTEIELTLLDGFELLEEARQLPGCARLPFVFMHKPNKEWHRLYLMYESARIQFLRKPFDAREYLEAIERLLEG